MLLEKASGKKGKDGKVIGEAFPKMPAFSIVGSLPMKYRMISEKIPPVEPAE
jgi:hypothetical protein